MREDQIVSYLRRMIQEGIDSGPDPGDQQRALNYYFGRPRGDEMPGRSIVQSLDVADMTHAILAQILPSFCQDSVCQFEPDGPEDDIPARLESDAVNKVMMESSRGYIVFLEAMKDALLLKNGIVKAYLTGEGKYRQIRLDAVDPLGFIVSDQQDCILLDQYRGVFCGERKEYTRGQLIGMGLDRDAVGRIPEGDDSESQTQNTRRRSNIGAPEEQIGWANERVTIWELYASLPDKEDSPDTTLYRCLLGGQELLLQEKTDTIPYAAGTAEPLPHRFWGLSVYDLLHNIQDSKTAIKRGWLDNLANCNNSRSAINDQVNIEDFISGRPGGAVRVKGMGPVSDSFMPIPTVDVGPAASMFLAYEDQVRSDRGGAALQMAQGEMQTAANSISGIAVDRIFSVQELRAGMMARTLAETLLRSAFMLVHRLLRTELQQPLTVRMADQWVQVDPSTWRERTRVNIRSGLSPGERSRKAAAMEKVLSIQSSAMTSGLDGVMVTLPNLYNAALDFCSALELDAGEKYFTNPASQSSQQAGQAKAQQGQQMQAMSMQFEKAKLDLEHMKNQLEAQKADAELKFKYYDARLKAEIEEAKLIGAATADLNRVELEGQFALATAREGALSGATGAGNGSDQA